MLKGMAHPPPSGSRLVATRVLVVDDDFDSAEVVSVILTREGCEVRVGLNAQEALSIVASFTPEIALLDIGLPGSDGYELLAALQAIPALGTCRYVAVTGYDSPEARRQSRDAGFSAHLVKPVPIATLLGAIEGVKLSGTDNG